MKKYSFIVYILNGCAQLWLLGSILYCLLLCFFLTTGKDAYFFKSKTSILGSPNFYKDGYPVPVKLTVQMPADTIVHWEHGNANGDINLYTNQSFRYEKADSILNDTTIKKEHYFSKWLPSPAFNENQTEFSYGAADEFALFDTIVKKKTENLIATVNQSYLSDETINLKSKSKWKNFALALYSIISAISILLIAFNVVKLFNYIKKAGSFLNPLYKSTFNIGVILILSQFIKLSLSFLYSKWYGSITLEKVSTIENLRGREFNIQFNPALDFNLSLTLFGLGLIVIASLFKYGNSLEKDQTLTI